MRETLLMVCSSTAKKLLVALMITLNLLSISAAPSTAASGYEQAVYDACARYGCSGAWLYSTMMCESGGDPNAVGVHGEIGIMQFMPSTAYAYGPIDPWDPYASIDLAAKMFSEGLSYLWLCAG
jgi:soluble lytic murein transglycosylase-like protein